MELFHPSTIVESTKEIVDASFIQNEITKARKQIAETWQSQGRPLRSFEPEFDRVCYATLGKFKNSYPEAYFEAKMELDSYTKMNLITTVGERANAELSQWEYELEDNGIYAKDTNERAIEMYKRGRDFKRKNGNSIDFEREDAEIIGFSKIEHELLNAKEGTKMISISHKGNVNKGSVYTHNFCDIFEVKSRNNKRFIEAKRLAITHDPVASYEKINNIDPIQYNDNIEADSEYFLSHPIKIEPEDLKFRTADDVHKFLQSGKNETLSKKNFDFVIQRIESAIQDYLDGLTADPNDINRQLENLRGILNSADDTVDMINGKSGGGQIALQDMVPLMSYQLEQYKKGEVVEKLVGCGFSGGYGGSSIESPTAFSVMDFGKRAENDPNLCKCGGEKAHFHCPGKKDKKDCNSKIIVGKGITKCSNCGEGKKC